MIVKWNILTLMNPRRILLYPISIMQRNLVEIRSCAILGGFTLWIGFLVISRSMNVLPFDWLTKRQENCLLVGSCCLRNKR